MNLTSRCSFAAVARGALCLFFLVGLTGPTAQRSVAALVTLIDNNSSVAFDTSSPDNAFSWLVDGQEQLFQQAFWYRIGNVAESALHSLPHPVEVVTDADGNLDPDTLFVRYNGAGFNADVKYSLQGGTAGSQSADMGEQIKITNTTALPLDFHFFQYVDFDLLGTSTGDSAVFVNANSVRQSEGIFAVGETVVVPAPNHREIANYSSILQKLTDAVPSTLSDNPATGAVIGPGDMTWSFQWDVTIPVGGSFLISKDKQLTGIPEPATGVLLMLSAGAILIRCRKR